MQKFFTRVLASLLGGGEAALRTVRGGETSLAIAEIEETSAGVVCRYAPSPRVVSLTVTARGEADAQSDLDFLYDDITCDVMFAYFGFVQDLEDEFGCHVDAVSMDIRDKKFLTEI